MNPPTITTAMPRPDELVRLTCPACRTDFILPLARLRELRELSDDHPDCGCVARAEKERKRRAPRGPVTLTEYILLAMRARPECLPAAGGLHKAAIVVAAWKLNPVRFGLKGFEDLYPSDNRVIMDLVKMSTPAAGLTDSLGASLYRLTPAGLSRANLIHEDLTRDLNAPNLPPVPRPGAGGADPARQLDAPRRRAV